MVVLEKSLNMSGTRINKQIIAHYSHRSRNCRMLLITPAILLLSVKVGFLYSAAYTMTGPAHCTISEVAVDWQEPMVLQRKLRPSNCTC